MGDDLERLCAAATAAWPDIPLDRDAFAAAVAEKADLPATPELAAELHLALGCARGDDAAVAAFEARYLDVVTPALAHMKLPAATVDDVRAAVRDKLLLPDGDRRPRILDYAGQGRLRGLVQVSAVRTAISMLRQLDRELPIAGDDVAAGGHDAELVLIKEQYRAAFSEAFTAAAGALEKRDRNLLRLHHLGGVTLEQLASMHGVHRATIVRWLAAAREALFAGTRSRMRDQLKDTEIDEVLELIQSRLDVSIGRLLASHTR
jgi:RNA polymerase sigma-70 factor (ECF subfamily)